MWLRPNNNYLSNYNNASHHYHVCCKALNVDKALAKSFMYIISFTLHTYKTMGLLIFISQMRKLFQGHAAGPGQNQD